VRRRSEVIWRAVDDRVVGLDLRSSRYFSLNDSAAFLWVELEHQVGSAELAARLVDRYGIEPEAARSDVEAFLADMFASGLVEQ
jgi:hypothetical protein